MSKAVANLTQSTETITFSAQDNGETISVNITEAARGPNSVTIATASDGTANLSLNSLTFNNAPVAPVTTPGSLSWNDQEGTLDLKMKGGNVTLQVGQENVIRVVNKTGGNLTQAGFKVVRVRKATEGGAQGQRLAVVLAQGDSEFDSTDVIGVVTEDIAVNQEGFVTTFGTVNGIDTTGALYGETWVDGELLFLSPTIAGGLTKVKPTAPNHLVIVGYVQYAHQNNGKLFVKTETSYELDELHNVSITDPATGEVLAYNGTTGLWENTEISTSITTSTPANLTGYIYGDGTNVAGSTAATDLSTGSTLMARAADGSTAVEYLNVGTFTGGSPIGGYGLFTTDPTGFSGAEVSGSPSIRVGNGTHLLSFTSSGAAFASGTITTSQPLSVTQTWNAGAVTFKGIDVNITDTASASGSLLMDLRVGGTSRFSVRKDGRVSIGTATITFNGTDLSFSNPLVILHPNLSIESASAVLRMGPFPYDIFIARDAANTLAQRNGTNAQESRVYGTYTSATNFERLNLKYNGTANAFQIGTEKGTGGGVARPLEFQTDGTTRMTIGASGGLTIASGGSIATSGGGGIAVGNLSVFSNNISFADWNASYRWTSGTAFAHNSSTRSPRIVFGSTEILEIGGSTASFPALKRSSAILQARLADDSAYTTIDAQHRLQGTAPASAAATGTAGDIRYDADYIYICTATNTWKRAALATWP